MAQRRARSGVEALLAQRRQAQVRVFLPERPRYWCASRSSPDILYAAGLTKRLSLLTTTLAMSGRFLQYARASLASPTCRRRSACYLA